MADQYDVIVLGSGPGGYVAAIRAAQLGLKTAIVERENLGGICLNWGCIPTKALLRSAEVFHYMTHADAYGLSNEKPSFDLAKVVARSRAVAKQLNQGVTHLMKKNKIVVHMGEGAMTGKGKLSVKGADGKATELAAKHIIVATGARARDLPFAKADGKRIWTYRHAMVPTEMPTRLLVIGSGAIGVEFASFYHDMGAEVTIVEMLPRLIPMEDEDASKELAKQFDKRGIALHLGKQCTKVEEQGGGLRVHFGEGETVDCDLMLVSVGRAPLVEGLGLEEAGVAYDRRTGIATDAHRRTSVPHVYAVGDCAGHWQLAHTAFREGEVAAENALGHEAVVDARGVPRPIYTDPEIAAVGLTEAEAREQHGDDVAVGVFPWIANARAVMQNDTAGWVKSIHETRYGELLGLVMVGPHVTDMIEAGVVALDAEATVETVADGIAPHPTLSEAIKEAGLVALGRAIHLPPKRKAAAKA
jgi:dihydrolipoamide dehydrogenase